MGEYYGFSLAALNLAGTEYVIYTHFPVYSSIFSVYLLYNLLVYLLYISVYLLYILLVYLVNYCISAVYSSIFAVYSSIFTVYCLSSVSMSY